MSFNCNTDSFESFILSCMENRIDELSTEYSNSSQYSDFYNQYNDILKKLEHLLPHASLDLIMQLDSLYGSLSADCQNFFYKQGFLDCRMIFNLLHK